VVSVAYVFAFEGKIDQPPRAENKTRPADLFRRLQETIPIHTARASSQMAPKPSYPQEKVLAASQQLQEALVSAAEALKTIADIIPGLAEAVGFSLPQPTASSTPLSNRRVPVLKDQSADATPASNKRKRNQKNPDAPDRPLSAYHLYAKEKREQVKSSLGADASGSDVVHEINRLWKELSDDFKKVSRC
jgi:HMG (high mobility group) box